MTPQTQSDIKQNFVVTDLPSKTFKLNHDVNTVVGTIDSLRAVEQAVYLILNTERYEWLIHSWDYGVEFRDLIGKDVDYCIPEIVRRIKEALLQDDRIQSVKNFQFTINNRKVHVTFDVISTFGKISIETGVNT